MSKQVFLPTGPEAMRREGLRETPEIWEDGLRAEPKPGNFEWWYFDVQLEDGSTAVVSFFTKTLLDRGSRLKPGVSVNITRPDGHKLSQVSLVQPADFSSSKERCYVRAGESWVRGDLCSYELHAKAGDLVAQLNLNGLVPAWRPGTGKIFFDEALTRYFAWFPAVPYGTVEGHLIYDGQMHPVKGACYHDHNWGNIALNTVLSQWYWGRAHLGDYSLIFAEMTVAPSWRIIRNPNGPAMPRYDSQKIPIFMLAKGRHIFTDDGAPLRLEELDFIPDPGGRSYPEGLDIDWQNDSERVHLKLRDPALIDSFSLLDLLPTWQRVIGQIVANPYYFRFKAGLDMLIDFDANRSAGAEKLHTRIAGQALYELMLLR